MLREIIIVKEGDGRALYNEMGRRPWSAALEAMIFLGFKCGMTHST